MSQDEDIEKLQCCLARDQHFLIKPVILPSCGHTACKECVFTSSVVEKEKCTICGTMNDLTSDDIQESSDAASKVISNIDRIAKVIERRFDESLNKLKGMCLNGTKRLSYVNLILFQ